ncbi:MAG TPA: ribonuclease PH [Planctomycetota bacterium]|nr:ribonuclease PH [Planctomycetota bacterium]
MPKPRPDGRKPGELRPVKLTRGFTEMPPGSVLSEFGKTRVLCTATWTDGIPSFLGTADQGWLTAEYAMLPGSSESRVARDRGGRVDGRSTEIQRLVGRSLRGVIDLKALSRKTIWLDCDVLQADGGTRCAAITGAYVALVDCVLALDEAKAVKQWPILGAIAAVSVGVVGGEPRLDLAYTEDVDADVDANVVMNDRLELIEIQATAERKAFPRAQLDAMLALAEPGIREILAIQKKALGPISR